MNILLSEVSGVRDESRHHQRTHLGAASAWRGSATAGGAAQPGLELAQAPCD